MPQVIIPLPESVTVPAATIPSRTFPAQYILKLDINAIAMSAADTVYGESVPYDPTTGERLMSQRTEVRVPFWAAVQTIPSVAAAFAAVAAAWPDLVAFQEELRLAAVKNTAQSP